MESLQLGDTAKIINGLSTRIEILEDMGAGTKARQDGYGLVDYRIVEQYLEEQQPLASKV